MAEAEAEAMPLEMRGLALEGLLPMGCRFSKIIAFPAKADMAPVGGKAAGNKAAMEGGIMKAASWKMIAIPPTKADMAAVGGKAAENKAAATEGGVVKAASWSDFEIYNLAGNKAAAAGSKPEPAASKVGFKPQPASMSKVGFKPQPASKVEAKRKPAIVFVGTEIVPDHYIQSVLKRPLRRPSVKPESFYERFPRLREVDRVTDVNINALVDAQQDILRQYRTKGFARVGVERYDNGLKRLFILPEEESAA